MNFVMYIPDQKNEAVNYNSNGNYQTLGGELQKNQVYVTRWTMHPHTFKLTCDRAFFNKEIGLDDVNKFKPKNTEYLSWGFSVSKEPLPKNIFFKAVYNTQVDMYIDKDIPVPTTLQKEIKS